MSITWPEEIWIWPEIVRTAAALEEVGVPPAVATELAVSATHRLLCWAVRAGTDGDVSDVDDAEFARTAWPSHARSQRYADPVVAGGMLRSVLCEGGILVGDLLRNRLNDRVIGCGNAVENDSVSTPGFAGKGHLKRVSPHTPLPRKALNLKGINPSESESEKTQRFSEIPEDLVPFSGLVEIWNEIAIGHGLPQVARLTPDRRRLLIPWYRECGSLAVARAAMEAAGRAYGGMEGSTRFGLWSLIRPSNRQKWISLGESAPPAEGLFPVRDRARAHEQAEDVIEALWADPKRPLPKGYVGPDPRDGDSGPATEALRDWLLKNL